MNLDGVKKREYSEKKLYTGLQDLFILAINPSADKIKELTGRDDVKDPEYGGFTDDGTAKLRLDVWVGNSEKGVFPFKHTIWMENKQSVSSKGSIQYINEAGVQTWGKVDPIENPKMSWFTRVNHRIAFVGETDLYNLLVAWIEYDQKADENTPMLLETPFSDIVSGDLSELNSLVEVLYNKPVRMLLAVKEGKYQTAYPKVITTAGSKYVKGFENELKRDAEAGYPYKGDYQNSFTFKEYTGEEVPAAPLTNKANVNDLLAKIK